VLNIKTNRVVRVLGKSETIRFLNISLFQGVAKEKGGPLTIDMAASDNPAFQKDVVVDSTLFATAFKTKRFFLLTKNEPSEEETYKKKKN